ncbi:hypothetical protein PIGHUM_04350 [Pigmentiphaga humi]|uniref:Squalene cyclase C-terminal domain-containing protein n=1 Tax=Pigmentiphaga humi TaxID=2478468 RepID=A0A3P4B8I4_9BURK|nr:hypothetical protein [Pigmentiphaga humi]VCU72251.1 hypothetical protein PIGHUM_04350 [Pigmentiphaga humi]
MMPASLTPILAFSLAHQGWEMSSGLSWLSSLLPAVACAGVEFRMDGKAEGVIDLQQRIKSAADVERLRLRVGGLLQRDGGEVPACWRMLEHAIGLGVFELPFDECWLELDHVAQGQLPALSCFIKFDDRVDAPDLAVRAERWLACFGQALGDGARSVLQRCQAACRPGQRVSYLGFMLGRPGAPLRLIVEGVAWDGFQPLLGGIGWQGDGEALQRELDFLFGHFDRIRLALTVGDAVEAAFGLECFVGRSGERDMRWSGALGALAGRGLCTEAHRRRIAAWPDTATPATASAPWPDAMLIDALAKGANWLGRLDFRISHVKLGFDGKALAGAKAYLGFVETWEDLAAPASVADPARRGTGPRSAGEACGAALDFLLDSRMPGGWWLDYPGLQNASDEWVSAYAANAILDHAGDAAALAAAARAWSLLSTSTRDGWGWNRVKPADADSSIWALRLAARLGAAGARQAHAGLDFLRAHMSQSGGLRTYARECVKQGPHSQPMLPAWFDVQDCVTAAAAGLEAFKEGALGHLRRSQGPEGAWTSYWWVDAAYPTALAVEALAASPQPGDRAIIGRAVDWAARRCVPAAGEDGARCGGPFSRALLARILGHAAYPDKALLTRLRDGLLQDQLADGSWTASAWMAIPLEGRSLIVVDGARIITSSTVLASLARLRHVV